ncbi:FAD-binding and (Fe-S)-binding domain-containing protein [Crateriforma conspicua]|uniref:Anaerobic glycerol-3-phosphate dehydrogenase subunit C n=1 Tax=Crateriforma conspicua TaxID=2527996 RepID=A0A5C5Y734_9PLAN|nr:FAD-binding and (Fe-S)-binding domain-containing protein [Crateriforma conspicua]QDV64708.1 Anaerobic glycerol-3-phosphate dehydrogenase subunit C [Crateriforma conspicua]TWT70105.1 Anaerobic glycerol-3-phosphate dehydrogenase subunit C [Crateriforma conspicua]
MDIEQQRVQDDLRGVIAGDVLCDPLSTQLYASDASIYQVRPLGVICPAGVADVLATVRYACEHDIPLHPRGAGSGVAGESLGRGLVLDFSRHMRRVTASTDAETITVQSGAVLADVNRAIQNTGRMFGPDPATRSVTTMGSVVATNASGSHYLRSGAARDTVESVRVVTMDGELVELKPRKPSSDDLAGKYALGLNEIRHRFADLIQQSTQSPPSRGGYRLDDVFADDGTVHLGRFFAGTQGTLAIMVDATMRTEVAPKHRGVALLFFHRVDSAARMAVAALDHGPVACDLMDRRLLQIARETEPGFADLLPIEAEAMLLIEVQGDVEAELEDRLRLIYRNLSTGHDGAFGFTCTTDEVERNRYWSLCRRVVPRQYRVRSSEAPLAFMEDLAVPVGRLPAVLTEIQDALKRHHTTATVFAHAGHGQLHIRPFLNLANSDDRDRLMRLSEETAEVVWKHGGAISVEHAAGLSRSYLMPKQYGELWQAMGQIKRLFDPLHRLHPGKYFGAILQKPNENLRPADQTIEITFEGRTVLQADTGSSGRSLEGEPSIPQLEVIQHWPGNATISQVTRACNGCGRCRTNSPAERQCPVYRASLKESATPRAKANLLRGVISGQLPVDCLTDDAAKAVADSCFNCHQCRVDCPASVNIPKIVGELKSQYVATNGLPLSDLLMGRIDTVAAIASRLPWLSNQLRRSVLFRWVAERMLGLAAARPLPPVQSETFLRLASKRRWNKATPSGGLKVVYFVDHYANYHDPDIGRALAEILQQNRIGLFVPTSQVTSGMPRITSGDLKGARKIARRNVRMLAEHVRQGYTIVATEPAAALCLKYEYPNLLDDEDAHLVAKHSYEACSYLWELHQGNRLSTEFNDVPLHLAYHQPCHLRVLDPDCTTPKLLSVIPGVNVRHIEAGCTGMAGTWGLQRKNYRNSLRIGWPLISAMRLADRSVATTECSSCKMQIEHGSGRETVHPLKLLAHAYGRMPKIAEHLEQAEDQ